MVWWAMVSDEWWKIIGGDWNIFIADFGKLNMFFRDENLWALIHSIQIYQFSCRDFKVVDDMDWKIL